MNQRNYIVLLCGIIFLLPANYVRSQVSSPPSMDSSISFLVNNHNHPWWVNLGAGPAFVGNTFAMNAGMVYCYPFEHSIISARILGVTNNNPTVQQIDPSTVIYKMTEYGILYGPMWHTGYGYVSVGAGMGLVRAGYENGTDISTNTSVSIPLEAQWFWRCTSYAGIGLETYAALNFEKPFYGILVCVQLGGW